jgi:molybdopterin-guanine dinucleotide biosynthesis protein A
MKKRADANQKSVTVEQRKVFRKKSEHSLKNLTGVLLTGGKSSRLGFNKLDIRNCSIPLFIDQIVKLSFFCNYILVVTSVSNFSLIATELKKVDSYFDFFYKYIRQYYKVQRDFVRNCGFPDKIPEITLLVDEDFNDFEQSGCDAAAAGLQSGVENCGPILGIYTGLKNAPDYYSLVLAADMPFVSHRLLQLLTVYLKINFTCDKNSTDQTTANFNPVRKSENNVTSFTTQKKCRDIYIAKSLKGFEVLCGIYSKFCINTLAEKIKAKKNKISDIFTEIDTQILEESILQTNGIDALNFFNINKLKDYDDFINIWNSKAFNIGSLSNPPRSNEEILFAFAWAEFFLR